MNQPPPTSAGEIRISELSFSYESQGPTVLQIPELIVPEGQFVSILGASGCGKSTLLRLVAGLLSCPGQSNVRLPDAGVAPGMVFQSPNLVPWRTARSNVLLPSELGQRQDVVPDQKLDDLFRLVGLTAEDTLKRPAELSGGMQMRVSIARALVLEPRLLLLDEPFAALDDLLRMQLEEELRSIHTKRQLTTVLVTHNINEAVFMSDRVLVLGGSPSGIAADVDVSEFHERNSSLRSQPRFYELVAGVTRALYSANDLLSSE